MPYQSNVDLERPFTWVRYRPGLCQDCQALCCRLPVEVTLNDLIRIGLAEEFDREEPLKNLAKRLKQSGHVRLFHHKSEIFTLAQQANKDCLFLDQETRQCTIYDNRPETCRQHPVAGPRPGFCAYKRK